MNLWGKIKANGKLLRYAFCVALPLFLLPLAISPEKELRCSFVVIVVAVYWLLEPVHIAATAFLPVVLFPMLGVLSSAEVSSNYMSETFMMFIGGLIVAIAIEKCNLHERIALKVLLLVGTHTTWLMLGFMLTTMFLSMWVSNTATTAMMVPIVEAVVAEMSLTEEGESELNLTEFSGGNSTTESQGNPGRDIAEESSKTEKLSSIRLVLLLSVCYSANIGGTGTLTGTGPNLVLKGFIEETYPGSDEITFASWMAYNIPGMIICVIIAWLYLYLVFVRCSKNKPGDGSNEGIREVIRIRYEKLGKITFDEAIVIVFFVLLVLLWIFRKPKFIGGWEDVLGSDTKIGDSVPAMAVAFLFFLLPSNPRKLSSGPLLDWKTAQRKLPWGVIILIGGGFALANGAQKSGLSRLLGQKLSSLKALSPGAIAAVMCFITAIITEVLTNTTAANIILPVMNEMAVSMKVNPIFIMLPVAITCSYAFMLPVATPPNAIAFDSGQMKTLDMVKPGFVMNMVCCCVQLFMINVLGVVLFNLNEFPEWAMEAYNATTANNGTYASPTT